MPHSKKIAFTVTATLLGAILGILFFILFDLFYSSNLGVDIFNRKNAMGVSYPYGWYGLKKNFKGESSWGDSRYIVYTDQYGYRVRNSTDMSRKFNKDAEIIFLGDSFTYGGSSSWEESYVGMVEIATKMKIINAGVYSYSPTAYLYQYKEAIHHQLLKPGHIVIVAIDVSDIQDEAAYRTDGLKHPISTSQAQNYDAHKSSNIKQAWAEFKNFKNNHLILSSQIIEMIRKKSGSFPSPHNESEVYDLPRSAFTWFNWGQLDEKIVTVNETTGDGYWPLGVKGGLNRTESKLHDIVTLAKHNDAKVYILAYPWPGQIKYSDKFNWSSFLVRVCQKTNCNGVIDTIPTFRDLASRDSHWYQRYYIKGDIHFNLEGNKILANSIIKKFTDATK